MASFSHRGLLKMGSIHNRSSLDRRRIALFNYLILFCVTTCLLLAIATLFLGLTSHALLSFIAAILLSGAFWLNHLGKITFSKGYFIFIGVSAVVAAVLLYLRQGVFTDAEIMLYAAMAISMFLIDGLKRHIAYWLIFGVFITLKILILDIQGIPFGHIYAVILANNLVVASILYLFLYVFRSILIKEFERSDRNEHTLRSLVDNTPLLMALVNRNGDFILCNSNYASRFGYSAREIKGKNRKEVLPKHIFEKHEPMFQEAINEKRQVSFLEETSLPDGSNLSANGKYEPIFDANGEVEAVAICVDDVSELIRAHKALKVANETKDKLFSIIAHDIKSPLNLFQSILQLNSDGAISKEQFMVYQNSIKDRLQSLTSTVDELLEWARMQLGGINAYPVEVNINNVVRENADLFHTLIEKKQIDFKIDTPKEMIAWIDENHFKVAIRNLIHNAIKYTNGGGRVRVRGNQTTSETIVCIEDSGIGMTSDQIASIIKKEIQKSKAGTNQEMGTGLGLSLSLGLLEKNQCLVEVFSEPNKGTKIEIKIPHKEVKPGNN